MIPQKGGESLTAYNRVLEETSRTSHIGRIGELAVTYRDYRLPDFQWGKSLARSQHCLGRLTDIAIAQLRRECP